MGQSEYGGLSNIGAPVGGVGIGGLGSGIPTLETGKSRRTAARPST